MYSIERFYTSSTRHFLNLTPDNHFSLLKILSIHPPLLDSSLHGSRSSLWRSVTRSQGPGRAEKMAGGGRHAKSGGHMASTCFRALP